MKTKETIKNLNKDRRVSIRLSLAGYARVKKIADEKALSVGAYIRMILMGKIKN